MKWQIGGMTFRDVAEPLPAPQLGEARKRERLLVISPTCPADARLEIFLHEYLHAWRFFLPPAAELEAECDQFAVIVTALLRDLTRQGGLVKLLSMGTGVVLAAQPTVYQGLTSPVESRGLRCEVCQRSVGGESVAQHRIDAHPVHGVPAYELSFYCEHCDDVQVWSETTNAAGSGPSGTTLNDTRRLRGPQMVTWLKANPDKSGVIIRD